MPMDRIVHALWSEQRADQCLIRYGDNMMLATVNFIEISTTQINGKPVHDCLSVSINKVKLTERFDKRHSTQSLRSEQIHADTLCFTDRFKLAAYFNRATRD